VVFVYLAFFGFLVVSIIAKVEDIWWEMDNSIDLYDQDAPEFPETQVIFHPLPWRVVMRQGRYLVVTASEAVVATCRTRAEGKEIVQKAGELDQELKFFARLARQPGPNNVL
jgi:hypothetical protein